MSKPKIFEQMESAGSFWITDDNVNTITYDNFIKYYNNNIPIYLKASSVTNDSRIYTLAYAVAKATQGTRYYLYFTNIDNNVVTIATFNVPTFAGSKLVYTGLTTYTITNKSGDTMAGSLLAKTNTDFTRQMRNITLATTEPISSDGYIGDVWIQYEAE